MTQANPKNLLAEETSPYLLQHADNPVHWRPWGPEALEEARRLDKPILLSIGYSACHWCHVMAHESFEDEQTAALMNELFVNIKVDREERPDLDKIYQTAHQFITQAPGGWPLTMFLAPADQTPYFGGTYFPPEARHGLPPFRELLQRVAAYYREHGAEISQQATAIREVYQKLNPSPASEDLELSDAPLEAARKTLERDFDQDFGGFSGAPKFPHPTSIERLLRHWRFSAGQEEPDVRALYMATFTLQRMAQGGLYDQLGGGFCRYSVDQYWMIPHFEKMLYDNGPLLALNAEAWRATGDEFYHRVAADTAAWVMREMQATDGGYYSTLDADSEGVEGKYYVWDPETVRSALEPEEYAVLAPHYGLDRAANFEGHWHLHVFRDLGDIAETGQMTENHARKLLDGARDKLFALREQRVRPGRDDKVLVAWNGLMIRGMAMAARHLERPELLASATRAADFIHTRMWRDGRLLACYKDGQARFPAYLDDYAFLAEGLLELLQTRWRSDYLAWLRELADCMLAHFRDTESGGFFFTADDHEALIHRPKHFSDDATPSGNGIAARVLLRLGHLLGEPEYLGAAEGTLRSAWEALARYPHAHGALLNALEEYLHPGETVILRGEPEALAHWQSVTGMLYAPRRQVFAVPTDADDLPEAIGQRAPRGEAVAYVCRGTQCSAPLESVDALAEFLRESEAGSG